MRKFNRSAAESTQLSAKNRGSLRPSLGDHKLKITGDRSLGHSRRNTENNEGERKWMA